MKGIAPLAIVIALVGGIMGFTIVDAVVRDSTNLSGVGNETQTLSCACNATDTGVITLNNKPLATTADGGRSPVLMNTYGNFTLTEGTHYSITSYANGQITVNDYLTATNGTGIYVTYDYEGTGFLDSSLSRTVATYIVPLGLIGLLALAALVA